MRSLIQTPPRWVEILLERMLAARDRETVAGDLREEYAESIFPQRGRLIANLWYLRQVSSFLPVFITRRRSMKKTLLCLSFFTFASTCWLTLIEMVLRHPGYLLHVGQSVLIALISLATLSTTIFRSGLACEKWLRAGAVILIGNGGQAFVRNSRAAHFEGFVLLISAALLLQGLVMLLFRNTTRPLA